MKCCALHLCSKVRKCVRNRFSRYFLQHVYFNLRQKPSKLNLSIHRKWCMSHLSPPLTGYGVYVHTYTSAGQEGMAIHYDVHIGLYGIEEDAIQGNGEKCKIGLEPGQQRTFVSKSGTLLYLERDTSGNWNTAGGWNKVQMMWRLSC